MRFGLSEETIAKICGVFSRYDAVESAVLYGSRAKGNFHEGSDIDVTLKGKALDTTQLCSITNALDDLMLPYSMDVSIYHQLEQQDILDHIHRVGVELYRRV